MTNFKLTAAAALLLAGTAAFALPAGAQTGSAGATVGAGTDAGGGAQKRLPEASATGNAATKAETPKQNGDKAASDNSARDLAPGQRKATGEVNSATEAAPGQRKANGEVDSAKEAAPGQMKDGQMKTNAADAGKPSGETTASVNITTEQRTEVRNIIVREKVAPAKIDFSVSVGVAVPKTVVLHQLPSRIVEIVPAYRGYNYFLLADGRIVIVRPATLEVVYILSA